MQYDVSPCEPQYRRLYIVKKIVTSHKIEIFVYGLTRYKRTPVGELKPASKIKPTRIIEAPHQSIVIEFLTCFYHHIYVI